MQPIATKLIDSVKECPPGTKLSMDDLRSMAGDRDKIATDRKKNQQVYYARRRMLDIGLLERERPNEFIVTGKVKEEPKTRRRKARSVPQQPTANNVNEFTVEAPMKVRVVKGQVEASVYGHKLGGVSLERILQELIAQKA